MRIVAHIKFITSLLKLKFTIKIFKLGSFHKDFQLILNGS